MDHLHNYAIGININNDVLLGIMAWLHSIQMIALQTRKDMADA